MGTSINVLTVNAGSSSIKLALFSVGSSDSLPVRILQDSATNIDHSSAITAMLDKLADTMREHTVSAICHRIVHGGPKYGRPQIITDEFKRELRELERFDPVHTPAAVSLIDALSLRFPDTIQVACFDTAFFHDVPRMAQIIPLPHSYEAHGLRRYGFHGLSYTYLLSAFRQKAGEVAADGRVIFAHLGSGASLAAIKGGKPVDMTMGFTPASGVMMSTRSGDVDPGIEWYLQRQAGIDSEAYNHMVNFESGLLGVSGLSGDMLNLLQNEAGNERAAEAVSLFCYQVKKSIGALAATLGGLDSLVFSGGIGEQAPAIRERICSGLDFLGIQLDGASNDNQADLISAAQSKVGVHVMPTDESLVMAQQTFDLVSKTSTGNGE